MDPKELFTSALTHAAGCVHHVHTDQLANSTPCTEWDLKTLLNHMVYELLWVPDLLQGKTVSEVGDKYDGDVLGDDLQNAWNRAADAALTAITRSDLVMKVHLSYGDVPAADYIKEISDDMCIHGWDVAQSTKCNLLIDEDVAQSLYDFMLPRKEGLAGSGGFAAAIETPETANIQTKLLALLGRQAEQINGAN